MALAGVVVVAVVSAIAGNLVYQRGRGDAVSTVIGGDPAALGARLYEAPAGLAIQLSDAERARMRGLLADTPLDGTVFALAALDATARGDAAYAAKLVDHALAVNPRTRLAWLWRLDAQMRQRQGRKAVNSVLRLLAVDPGQYQVYIQLLANLAKDQRNLDLIAAALRSDPSWRPPFLSLLEAGGYDPAIRYALMGGGPAKVSTAGTEQNSFVSDLISKGDYERAYLAWISYLPDSALSRVDTPYDATFTGLPGAAPFNWQFSTIDGDRAAIEDGLDISYSGKKPTTLASQVVVLKPGDYRLRSVLKTARSEGAQNGGSTLTWQVQCMPTGSPIGSLPLNLSIAGKAQLSGAFRIPDSACPAVLLALVGSASEFPVRLNAKVGTVRFERVGTGEGDATSPAPAATASPVANTVKLP